MKKIITTACTLLTLTVSSVQAEEKYSHFPSLASPNTSVALCNLAKFNPKLQGIVNKEAITAEEMVKIHELTYTLENAVMRLQKDLQAIAIDLEKVHKASERMDDNTIKSAGKRYLEATATFVRLNTCDESN